MHEAPQIARSATLAAAVGSALTLGAVSLATLALVWAQAFPWAVAAVAAGLWVALVASVVLLACCLLQFVAWRGRRWGLERASWWAHVASYLVLLVALAGFLTAAAWIDPSMLGLWLCLGGFLLAAVGQAVGATQYLRGGGAPGTLRAHLRRAINRANARADARADAAGN